MTTTPLPTDHHRAISRPSIVALAAAVGSCFVLASFDHLAFGLGGGLAIGAAVGSALLALSRSAPD